MTKKHNRTGERERPKKSEWLDRRSFLMRAGKYSAAAAGLLAGSNALFGACAKNDDENNDADSGIENDDDSGKENVDDSGNDLLQHYQDSAQPVTLQGEENATVSADEEIVYSFTVDKEGDYLLTLSEDSSIESTIALSLVDATGELLWGDDAYEGATWTLENLSPGNYYLVIKSDGGTGTISFTITASIAEQDAGWNDYSEWTDANPWTNNTWSDSSGWKDAGSGTWVAHSDTWYNGEWNDGWMNYGYY